MTVGINFIRPGDKPKRFSGDTLCRGRPGGHGGHKASGIAEEKGDLRGYSRGFSRNFVAPLPTRSWPRFAQNESVLVETPDGFASHGTQWQWHTRVGARRPPEILRTLHHFIASLRELPPFS